MDQTRFSANNVVGTFNLAWESWSKGTAADLIDPSLVDDSTNEIMKCVQYRSID
ncbi:hypothetical protein Dsin_011475 [Dipteronia sinensis]|uniref:Uncharacterized protein n=1 Tax=Dipteronia sinensis TaxID=43782 RepID=A0AAE0AV76_9ROSI|nr:hypothetical protein Dsin_011475 [Dipteronia sinensis]